MSDVTADTLIQQSIKMEKKKKKAALRRTRVYSKSNALFVPNVYRNLTNLQKDRKGVARSTVCLPHLVAVERKRRWAFLRIKASIDNKIKNCKAVCRQATGEEENSAERILEVLHWVVESSRKRENLKRNKENAFEERMDFTMGRKLQGRLGAKCRSHIHMKLNQ